MSGDADGNVEFYFDYDNVKCCENGYGRILTVMPVYRQWCQYTEKRQGVLDVRDYCIN